VARGFIISSVLKIFVRAHHKFTAGISTNSMPTMLLIHRKAGILPNVGRMKRQYNIVFGYTHVDQFICHSFFRAVMLNPNFVAFDVNMQNTPANALIVVPSDRRQFIMLMLPINNGFDFKIPIRGFILSIALENVFNIGLILRLCLPCDNHLLLSDSSVIFCSCSFQALRMGVNLSSVGAIYR
jgi:hypothetical protein